MTTLVIMLLGMAAGCFFPAGRKKMNERVQLACTLVLIFSMGVGLSRRDNFFSELGVIGIQSFVFFLIPTICSIVVVYVLTRRFMTGKEAGAGKQAAGGRPSGRDPMASHVFSGHQRRHAEGDIDPAPSVSCEDPGHSLRDHRRITDRRGAVQADPELSSQ